MRSVLGRLYQDGSVAALGGELVALLYFEWKEVGDYAGAQSNYENFVVSHRCRPSPRWDGGLRQETSGNFSSLREMEYEGVVKRTFLLLLLFDLDWVLDFARLLGEHSLGF